MGKLTISMGIFHSYFDITRGYSWLTLLDPERLLGCSLHCRWVAMILTAAFQFGMGWEPGNQIFSAITMYSPCTWNLRFVVPPKRDVVGLCWFISPLTIHLYHHNISAVSPRNIGVINQVNYLGGTTFFLGKDGAKMDRHWIWSQEDDEGWDSVSMKQMAGLVNVQKTMEYHHL